MKLPGMNSNAAVRATGIVAAGIFCAALLGAGLIAEPADADEALAGQPLQTLSHGQPFCKDEAQLRAKVRAEVAHAPIPLGAFPGCFTVPDDVRVVVTEDLEPTSRFMHIVRARAYVAFGPLDAYTYSVGLYAPLRGYSVPPPTAYR